MTRWRTFEVTQTVAHERVVVIVAESEKDARKRVQEGDGSVIRRSANHLLFDTVKESVRAA